MRMFGDMLFSLLSMVELVVVIFDMFLKKVLV